MRGFGSLLVLAAIPAVLAVKSHDFKTCSQAGFCRRGRALSTRAAENPSWRSPYSVDASSVILSPDQAAFTAAIKSSIYPDVKFSLDVRIHDDGVVRVRMDEVDGLRKRYDEAASWALLEEPKVSQKVQWTVAKDRVKAVYGAKKDIEVKVTFEPLKVTLLRDGKEQVVLNNRGLLHMEHFRTKESVEKSKEGIAVPVPEEGVDAGDGTQAVLGVHPRAAWFEGEQEDGWWEETFNSFTDPKPKGTVSEHLRYLFVLTSCQVPSLFRSTSTSPTMVMSLVSPSTQRVLTFPPPLARTRISPTRIASSMPMCLSTLQTRPCRYTVPFHSCMRTLPTPPSPSSTQSVLKPGSTLAVLPRSPRRRTGCRSLAFSTSSSSLGLLLRISSRSTPA